MLNEDNLLDELWFLLYLFYEVYINRYKEQWKKLNIQSLKILRCYLNY
jgi:hypothetical protein